MVKKDSPMRFLLLLFIAMPIIEMWLLISVGAEIGALATIGLVLATALIGAGLLRHQGLQTLWSVQRKLAEGQMPAREIFSGIILAVSGALLLTPGFVTDALGFAALVPGLRDQLAVLIMRKMVVGGVSMSTLNPTSEAHDRGADERDRVIDGEYIERDDRR
jgi:UPF0716 protein FxsA|tara:strand:- start:2090 stop:2575 length:486 start_codon:yes stop_codon:yes gene_type:complete